MKSTFEIVVATQVLAERMAPNLRLADMEEVFAAYGQSPLQALERFVKICEEPRCWLINGEPAAMWGVEPVSLGARIGVPGMLGTDLIECHPVPFWRLCKEELARLVARWAILVTWIDSRYERSLRWARALGFSIDEPRPFGRGIAPFCCAAFVARGGA